MLVFMDIPARDATDRYFEDAGDGRSLAIAFDDRSAGNASHGERDLGGHVPKDAKRLALRFEPGLDFVPPGDWQRILVVDLEPGLVIEAE